MRAHRGAREVGRERRPISRTRLSQSTGGVTWAFNKHVQRTYSRVLHHSAWLDFYADLENNAPRREVVRFVKGRGS